MWKAESLIRVSLVGTEQRRMTRLEASQIAPCPYPKGLSGTQLFGLVLVCLLASPIAYVIRERRHRRPVHRTARRGAERTPLPPPNEDEA